jgi:hypothetical protein
VIAPLATAPIGYLAFAGQKTGTDPNVCSGSKAEVTARHDEVRSTPKSGHWVDVPECPLSAKSGHNAYQTFLELEPLGASLTLRIGKIAVERKAHILH